MKKLFTLIVIIVFTALVSNAQLKYQSGVLSFNGPAVTGAATTWRGNTHVFTNGSGSGQFLIKPSSNNVSFGTETNQITIYQDGRLSYGGEANMGAATTWRGGTHVFTNGAYAGEFRIKPGTTGAKIGSTSGALHIMDNSNKYQSIYSGRVYVEQSASVAYYGTISQATAKISQLNPVSIIPGSQIITTLGISVQPVFGNPAGFVPSELEQVIPYSVVTTDEGKKLIDYTEIIPYIVKAMQEQQAYIQTLEQRIQILESR